MVSSGFYPLLISEPQDRTGPVVSLFMSTVQTPIASHFLSAAESVLDRTALSVKEVPSTIPVSVYATAYQPAWDMGNPQSDKCSSGGPDS